MRIQRFLANHGDLGPRRACESLIESGEVTVNGRKASLGDRCDPVRDDVRVRGVRIHFKPQWTYMMYNKPRGVLCTFGADDALDGRPTLQEVLNRLRIKPRLFSVGRLDADAEGLLILTDDGDLAMRLAHPKFGCSRTYEVGLDRPLDPEDARRLGRLRMLVPRVRPVPGKAPRMSGRADRITPPVIFQGIGTRHVKIRLKDGRNHEVKRIFAARRYRVIYLRRIAFGRLRMEGLPGGTIRHLTRGEVELLKKSGI